MSYSRVVALCAFGFVFIGSGVCSQNEDRCGAGFVDCSADETELCIPHHKVCDGQIDCPGGLLRAPSRVVRKPKSKAKTSPPTVAAPTAPAANTTACTRHYCTSHYQTSQPSPTGLTTPYFETQR
eukprot:Em0013g507a